MDAHVYIVEESDGTYSGTWVGVAFTTKAHAEAYAKTEGEVKLLPVLDRPAERMVHHKYHGVLFPDGRLLNANNALAESGGPLAKYADKANRFGERWRSWDFLVPELISRVGPWSGQRKPGEPISISVEGRDLEAVKQEFYRIVAQLKEPNVSS